MGPIGQAPVCKLEDNTRSETQEWTADELSRTKAQASPSGRPHLDVNTLQIVSIYGSWYDDLDQSALATTLLQMLIN